MFCSSCGSRIADVCSFCPVCGAPTVRPAETPPDGTPAQEPGIASVQSVPASDTAPAPAALPTPAPTASAEGAPRAGRFTGRGLFGFVVVGAVLLAATVAIAMRSGLLPFGLGGFTGTVSLSSPSLDREIANIKITDSEFTYDFSSTWDPLADSLESADSSLGFLGDLSSSMTLDVTGQSTVGDKHVVSLDGGSLLKSYVDTWSNDLQALGVPEESLSELTGLGDAAGVLGSTMEIKLVIPKGFKEGDPTGTLAIVMRFDRSAAALALSGIGMDSSSVAGSALMSATICTFAEDGTYTVSEVQTDDPDFADTVDPSLQTFDGQALGRSFTPSSWGTWEKTSPGSFVIQGSDASADGAIEVSCS